MYIYIYMYIYICIHIYVYVPVPSPASLCPPAPKDGGACGSWNWHLQSRRVSELCIDARPLFLKLERVNEI